jgi:hypothetical protein
MRLPKRAAPAYPDGLWLPLAAGPQPGVRALTADSGRSSKPHHELNSPHRTDHLGLRAFYGRSRLVPMLMSFAGQDR